MFGDYSLPISEISEINDSNTIRDRRKELRILCYKVLALPMKEYSII